MARMIDDPELELLKLALKSGVPLPAFALFGRWWQLETYLREVVYTELRAKYGLKWLTVVDRVVAKRAVKDEINAYIRSADADDVLAYADTAILLALIDEHWPLFEPVLVPKQRWDGLTDLLLVIRHRSAHCRRPHRDDLERLELALRELEPGARRFYGSYADVTYVGKGKDPLTRAWLGERHPDAARLIKHCDRQYKATFRLGYSVRPWAVAPKDENKISNNEGVLWQASLILGATTLDPQRFWSALKVEVRDLGVHFLLNQYSVDVTFAAVDPVNRIADAIGAIFGAAIETRPSAESEILGDGLPSKAQVSGPLSLFDPLNPELVSIFAA
jgi:hypothetical protein